MAKNTDADKKAKKSKETTFTIADVIQLNSELQFLNKEPELSFVVKYELVKLAEKTAKIAKAFNEQKVELFKVYGKCTDKEKEIYSLEGSEKYKEGVEELNKLLEKEESFTENFIIKDFIKLRTANSYVKIMKFFD